MMESDISPFEVIHSGLVRCLLSYLTASENAAITLTHDGSFMASLTGLPGAITENGSLSAVSISTPRDTRLRNFLHVFLGCPVSIGVCGSLPGYQYSSIVFLLFLSLLY